MPFRRTVILGALAGLLAAPAAAHADAFSDVFADYREDGTIAACDHSQAALRAAREDVPNDISEYAPDFPAALEEAIEERARGGCDDGGGAAAAPAPPAATPGDPAAAGAAAPATEPGAPPAPSPDTPVQSPAQDAPAGTVPQPPGTTQPAEPATDGAIVNAAAANPERGGDGAPAPLIVLAVLGGLAALLLLVWGVARYFAWQPAWAAGAAHAISEAGWRASGVWEDFADWVRGAGRRSA